MTPKLRILVIQPQETWHWDFDSFFLDCFRKMGYLVTFVAPEGYLEFAPVDSRVTLPADLFRGRAGIASIWRGLRVLSRIRTHVRTEDYDAVVFLSYETIPLVLRWRGGRNVFIFEHNNIGQASRSPLRAWFYRRLPTRFVSLTPLRHMGDYVRANGGRKAVFVPHPYPRRTDVPGEGSSGSAPERRTVIFSGSGSTPPAMQRQLIEFAARRPGRYFVVCKGERVEASAHHETRPFFEDYQERLRHCDMMFFGAQFDYRASGVVFEALSHGKPVVLVESLMARELSEGYPHLVFPVKDVDDIETIDLAGEAAEMDRRRFLDFHGMENIARILTPHMRGARNTRGTL